ncbi:putative bifunctional diguanylate cyclase/phosphodiesterase [Paenibacillus methanolicus]|uniref:PAS domain S-box-containing protein/diguanylate cyclase (GGDEF)-like protein n=1 Tax=Paenibacillus methanolicus TaxID=582686 RepID=A0A5S5C7X2_9BACL|nr:EAL domain-containing protein [Paenibacillus methanolicus]TYP75505.1 PAS domain S-box-containing protein/diguanylate cyclase (GGDEF)-like protein [Paenibacillus methanolicus]
MPLWIISLLFTLLPSYLLFYMGAEIYWRNPRHRLHQLTMALMFTLGLMLVLQFAINHFLSLSASELAVRLRFTMAFLTMGFALLFFRHLTSDGKATKTGLALALVPFVCAAASFHSYFLNDVRLEVRGVHRLDEFGSVYGVLLGIAISYTFIGVVFMLVRKIMFANSRRATELKRISSILWGTLFTVLAVIVAVGINFVLRSKGVYTFNFLPTGCVIIWAFALRYAMVNHDFLAATGRRYELLFKLSHHGIVLLDHQCRVVEANASFAKLIGLAPGENAHGIRFSGLLRADERETFEEAYREASTTLTPLHLELVLNGMNGQTRVVEAHSDYIEIDGSLYAFLLARDMTQQKEDEERLAQLAYEDELTGLGNRRHFSDRIREDLAQGLELGVMLLDLDQFKWVNDTLGHSAGDAMLQQVAGKLRTASGGFVARLGGDEFGVLVHGGRDEVLRQAEAIIAAMKEPVMLGGKSYAITASIGISLAPEDGHDNETLLRGADTAMYVAKNGGRNQYYLFQPQLKTNADNYMTLVSGLTTALEKGELQLHFQPQIDLPSERVYGAEALLRWTSQELGAVPPGVFIPIAEANGLIVPIGRWVLEEAIRQAKHWVDQGCEEFVVSVNLSAIQLRDAELAGQVAGLLDRHGLPPRNLCLEITESTAIADVETSYQICTALGEMGVKLAIDDFGTGYSSLAVLGRFPFDFIKIDRSLVEEIVTNKKDLAVIRSVVALARDLGLQVVAEGVETAAQHEMLRGLGCHEGQGYLYGRPMSGRDMDDYLKRKGGCGQAGTA